MNSLVFTVGVGFFCALEHDSDSIGPIHFHIEATHWLRDCWQDRFVDCKTRIAFIINAVVVLRALDDNSDWIRVIRFQILWLLILLTRFVDFGIKECIHQQYRPCGLFFFKPWTTILTESKWLISASRRDMTCQNKECFHQYLTWVSGLSLCSGRWFRGNWSDSFPYQDDTLTVRLKTRFVDF
jgi:hypothetical protein